LKRKKKEKPRKRSKKRKKKMERKKSSGIMKIERMLLQIYVFVFI